MSDEKSAFEQDARRRMQQDAEGTLRKSVGIQDADGNQLHGRARTEAARNLREQMKAAAKAPPAEAKKPAAAPAPQPIRVVINAPNKAVVRDNEIALTIIYPHTAGGDDAAGSSDVTPWQPIHGVSAGAFVAIAEFSTLLDTDMMTNYVIDEIDTEFELTADDLIYLKLNYDGAEVLTDIELIGGAEWSGYPDPVETTGTGALGDPYLVAATYYPIAYCRLASDTGSPEGVFTFDDGAETKVIACVCGNPLALVLMNRNGLVFNYPYPPPRWPS